MMDIKIKNKKTKVTSSSKIRNDDFKTNRGYLSPAWGMVVETYSTTNSADVSLSNGLLLRNVTVLSKSWAGKNSNYPFGTQDLPPKDTEVLIVFPDNMIEEAVIVGSRFEILGEVGNSQEEEFLKSGQEDLITMINEFGWKVVYNKSTGVFTLTNGEEANFKIEVDANGYIIIQDADNNKIEYLSTGMKLTDSNSNIISMESGKVVINSNVEILQ